MQLRQVCALVTGSSHHALVEIPLGRMARCGEIAAACALMASDACASASGSCLDVNGASDLR
jgi:hypothetical protein